MRFLLLFFGSLPLVGCLASASPGKATHADALCTLPTCAVAAAPLPTPVVEAVAEESPSELRTPAEPVAAGDVVVVDVPVAAPPVVEVQPTIAEVAEAPARVTNEQMQAQVAALLEQVAAQQEFARRDRRKTEQYARELRAAREQLATEKAALEQERVAKDAALASLAEERDAIRQLQADLAASRQEMSRLRVIELEARSLLKPEKPKPWYLNDPAMGWMSLFVLLFCGFLFWWNTNRRKLATLTQDNQRINDELAGKNARVLELKLQLAKSEGELAAKAEVLRRLAEQQKPPEPPPTIAEDHERTTLMSAVEVDVDSDEPPQTLVTPTSMMEVIAGQGLTLEQRQAAYLANHPDLDPEVVRAQGFYAQATAKQ